MLQICETWIDMKRNATLGESGWYTPYTEDKGELFRAFQREYGRCISRVYINNPYDGTSWPIGWVFQQRRQYKDTRETYLAETWVAWRLTQ